MEEKITSFETSILARDKGFDEPCSHYYIHEHNNLFKKTHGELNRFSTKRKKSKGQPHLIIAPRQGLLQKWLRDVHNIHLTVIHRNNVVDNTEYYDYLLENTEVVYRHYPTWEIALDAGLMEALKMIENIDQTT